MAVNIDLLTQQYFTFDLPVPYSLKCGKKIYISPVNIKNSNLFRFSTPVFMADKDSIPDPKIIQMSYLQFISDVLINNNDDFRILLGNLLVLCLNLKSPNLLKDEMNRPYIYDNNLKISITHKEFDDIKRIILHQNLLRFDDEYISPDIKAMMNRVDKIKHGNVVEPSLERKMAIITAHCGLSKKDQEEYTMRSHQALFNECVGEVEFTTTRPVTLIFGGKNKFDHWIYKEDKGKYAGYMVSMGEYKKSFGGANQIITSDISNSQFNINELIQNFSK